MEAMTMKLNIAEQMLRFIGDDHAHIEHAESTELPLGPSLLVVLETGVSRVDELANDWDGPVVSREVAFLAAIDELLKDKERDNHGGSGVKPWRSLSLGRGEDGGCGEGRIGSGRGSGAGCREREKAEGHGQGGKGKKQLLTKNSEEMARLY